MYKPRVLNSNDNTTPRVNNNKTLNTPSIYEEIGLTNSPPPEVKKMGKKRKMDRSLFDGGYVTKKVRIQSPDFLEEVKLTVPKKHSLSPRKILNSDIRDSYTCGFCYRIPLNPLKTVPCKHWVCLECYDKWRTVSKTKCPVNGCSLSIKVEVPSQRELNILRFFIFIINQGLGARERILKTITQLNNQTTLFGPIGSK